MTRRHGRRRASTVFNASALYPLLFERAMTGPLDVPECRREVERHFRVGRLDHTLRAKRHA